MSLGGFTLADRLGARAMPCRVPGCTRTWLQLGGKSLALASKAGQAAAEDAGAGMCEPCKKKLATLQDKQRRCDVPGCPNTWTWTIPEQLEAFAQHKPPPKRICASCESKLATLEDKEIACSVPGCTRTGTVSKRAQLIAQAAAEQAAAAPPPAPVPEPVEAAPTEPAPPEAEAADTTEKADKTDNKKEAAPAPAKPGKVTITGPMCGPCSDVAQRLQDRAIHCGIAGCKRKWIWKADDQLQAFAAGKPNEPPRRMCETCRANFGKLLDREVRCRTSGCKKTWTWSRFDQLDACVADKPPPKAPARMCESCFDAFAKLKDVERPCRKAGCKRTWTDKRGAQLARLVRGKTGDPYPQYCVECQKELGDLDDREIACKTDGCTGTWTWTREQQLAAGVRPVPKSASAPAPEVAPTAGETAALPAADALATGVAEGGEGVVALAARAPDTSEEAIAAGAPAPPSVVAPDKGKGKGEGGGKGGRGRRGRRQRQIQPPERLCHACAEFLKDRKTLEIPCSQCATPIYWPPESQLQSHLGNWATPSLCGACKRDATEAARRAAKEVIRQQMDHSVAGHAEVGVSESGPPPSELIGEAETVPSAQMGEEGAPAEANAPGEPGSAPKEA